MEEPEFLIDPNDVAAGELHENGSLAYENLIKYAELTVHARGRSVINGNTNDYDSTGRTMKVNFLGFDPNTNQYTNNYTDYTPGSRTGEQNESFGMTEINVKVSASFIPVVKITFVDVRGLSMMNQGDESFYSALLMMPPPIFTLKIKGYFGKAVKMKLHMLRNNIKTDSSTGNTFITCSFTGSRYAPLADLPVKFITSVPFLEGQEMKTATQLQKGQQPSSFHEFVLRSKMLLESFGGLSADNESIQPILEAEDKLVLIDDIKDNITNLKANYLYALSSLTLDEEKDAEGKIKTLVVSCSESEDYKNALENTTYVEKQIILFKDETEKQLASLGKNSLKISYEKKTGIVPVVPLRPVGTTYRINVTGIEDYLRKQSTYYINRKKQKEKEAEEAINKVAIEQLGNLPYVGYIFSLLCKDIEKFLAMLTEVSQDAELHHASDTVKNNFKGKNRSVENKLETLYAWPSFAEKDENGEMKQQYLGKHAEFKDWPEVIFIEKLANALVNETNKAEDNKSRLTSEDNAYNADRSFIPLGPWNSSINEIQFSPYPERSINNVFSVFFRRAVTAMGYGVGYSAEAINFVGVTEAVNIASQLKDPQSINRLRHLADVYLQGGSMDEVFTNMIQAGELTKDDLKYYYGTTALDTIADPSGIIIHSKRSSQNFRGIEAIMNESQLDKELYDNPLDGSKVKEFLSKERKRDTYYGKEYDVLKKYNLPFIRDARLNGERFESNFTSNYKESLMFLADPEFREILWNKKDAIMGGDLATIIAVTAVMLGLPKDNNIKVRNLWEFEGLFSKPGVTEVPWISVLFSGLMVEILTYDAPYTEYTTLLDQLGFSDEDGFVERDKILVSKLSSNDKRILKSSNQTTITNMMIMYEKLFLVDYDDAEGAAELVGVLFDENEFDYLFQPVYILNNSFKTFSSGPDDDIYPVKGMKSSHDKILLNSFFHTLKETLRPVVAEENKFSKGSGVDSRVVDNDLKLSLYNQVKNIYDRWIAGNTGDIYQVEDVQGSYRAFYPFIYNTDNNPKLIDSFAFIDKGHNDISEKLIMSLKPFQEWGDHPESSIYNLVRDSLGQNMIHFYPLVNFMQFKNDEWKNSFRMHTNVSDEATASPAFVCLYVGGVSEILNQNNGGYGSDALDLTDPEDAENFNAGETHAFKVIYGKQNQSMFTGLQLDTEEHKETMESITYMQDLLMGSVENPSAKAQNLFNIYKQRSYTCGLEGLGNFCIQPTQYFQLYNVPMFNGSYLILETESNMDVTNVTTVATGVRVMKYSVPYVSTYGTFVQQRLEEIRLERGETRQAEADSDGYEPGSGTVVVAQNTTLYSFKDKTNVRFATPLAGPGAGTIVVNNLDTFLKTEGNGNFTLGQKAGYCQAWVSRVLTKAGLHLNPYPRSAWHFLAGLKDEVTFLTELKTVTGKETLITNADYQKLGVPDGSILFGYFKTSKYLYESVDVLEASDKFSKLQHANLMSEFVNNNKLRSCPVTHVGIWKNGSMYHLVKSGIARDTATMANFTPVAYVPFEKIITADVPGNFSF